MNADSSNLARLAENLHTEFGIFSAGLQVRIFRRVRDLYTVIVIEDPRHTLIVPRGALWFGRVKRTGRCVHPGCQRETLSYLRNGRCVRCAAQAERMSA